MEVKAKENGEKEVKNIKVTETAEKGKKEVIENKIKEVEKKETTNQVSSPIFGSEINYII